MDWSFKMSPLKKWLLNMPQEPEPEPEPKPQEPEFDDSKDFCECDLT